MPDGSFTVEFWARGPKIADADDTQVSLVEGSAGWRGKRIGEGRVAWLGWKIGYTKTPHHSLQFFVQSILSSASKRPVAFIAVNDPASSPGDTLVACLLMLRCYA